MLDRLIDTILGALHLFQFWVVVAAYERGVVLRLGLFHRELGPGFHWVIPFAVDRVWCEHTVPRTMNLGPQSLTTSDGVSVVVSAIVTAKIVDIQRAVLNVESVDHAMRDACYAEVAGVIMRQTWPQLNKSAELETELERACQRRATKWGIEIVRVQLSDVSRSRSLRLWHEKAAEVFPGFHGL